MLPVLFLLAGGAGAAPADSTVPPTIVVRPLPVRERPAIPANPTKAQVIAASWTDTTTAYHPLGPVSLPDGAAVASPTSFTCLVNRSQLTVSYVREGFDTKDLPSVGTCGEGEGVVTFRIEVEAPGSTR